MRVDARLDRWDRLLAVGLLNYRPAALAIALAVVLAGCNGKDETQRPSSSGAASSTTGASSTTAERDPSIPVTEANSASLLEGATAVVVSVKLESTARHIRATRIEPVADPGLSVTYLGYSYCLRGCPGAGPWNADMQEIAEKGMDGTVPLDIPRDGKTSRPAIVLLLQPEGEGIAAVQARCLLVHGLTLDLADGRRVFATFTDGGAIAGVQIPDRSADYKTCRQLMD